MGKLLNLLGWIWLSAFASLAAQELSKHHYGIAEGLAQSQVTDLLMDSRGYLWVGTKEGLSRFDGMAFKNYGLDDGLPDMYIEKLQEDSKGRIWISTRNGIVCLQGDSVVRTINPKQLDGIQFLGDMMAIDKEGKVWLMDKDSHIIIVCEDGTYEFHPLKLPLYSDKGRPFFSYLPEQDRILVFKMRLPNVEEAFFINANDLKACSYYKIEGNGVDNSYGYRPKAEAGYIFINGEIYKSEPDGIRFHSKFYGFEKISRPGPYSLNFFLAEDESENLRLFASKNNRLIEVDENGEKIWINEVVNDIILHQGVLWLGTENGLFKIMDSGFTNYTPENFGIHKSIWAIAINKEKQLFLGSYFGHGMQMIQDNKITDLYKEYPILNKSWFNYGATCTADNTVLIPGTSRVFAIKDNQIRIWIEITAPLYIYEEPSTNNIYLGCHLSIAEYDTGNGSIKKHHIPGMQAGCIVSICADEEGYIWCGGHNYLARYDPCTESFKSYSYSDNEMPMVGVRAMVANPCGGVWMASVSGLVLYKNGHFYKTAVKDKVGSMVLLDDGRLLLEMPNKLGFYDAEYFYDTGGHRIEYINSAQGYAGDEIGQNSMVKSPDGTVWIATGTKGLVHFDPKKFQSDRTPPNPIFTDFKVYEELDVWYSLVNKLGDFNQSFVIPYSRNNVEIAFAGLDLQDPQGVSYRYRLLGKNERFSSPVPDSKVVYTNLRPGNYTFQLYAANRAGAETSSPRELHFTILTPFYRTWWFITSLAALMVGGLTYIIRSILQSRYESQQRKTIGNLTRLQQMIGSHFLNNTLSEVHNVFYTVNREEATGYIRRLEDIIRFSLENQDKFFIRLDREIAMLHTYIELMQFNFNPENRFKYKLSCPDHLLDEEIPQMIIQPFVENAIRHGLRHRLASDNFLQIEIADTDTDTLVCTISDNGIGRHAAKKIREADPLLRPSTGNKLVEDRCQLMTDEFDTPVSFTIIDLYEGDRAAGTRVQIKMALSNQ